MGLISSPGGLFAPQPRFHRTAIAAGTLLNGSAQRFGYIVRAPRQGVLDKFELRTYSTTSVAVGSSIKFSFQDVSTGVDPCVPDGVVDQYRNVGGASISAGAWLAPGLMTSDGTDGGSKRAVNRNELLALVVEYETFTGGDVFQISDVTPFFDNDANEGLAHFPYEVFYAPPWVRDAFQRPPLIALKYSDGIYSILAPEVHPISSVIDLAFNSGSTPDERGARFRYPFPIRVRGCWIARNHASAGAYDVVLYDSDGATPIDTVSIDPDQVTDIAANDESLYVRFNGIFDLLANTYYRLVIKPTSVTDTRYQAATASSQALMDGFPGGQDWHATRRTDAGAWTDVLNEHPYMGFHIDGIEEEAVGAGGGGPGGFVAVSRNFRRGFAS